jgi:hypothetical protein
VLPEGVQLTVGVTAVMSMLMVLVLMVVAWIAPAAEKKRIAERKSRKRLCSIVENLCWMARHSPIPSKREKLDNLNPTFSNYFWGDVKAKRPKSGGAVIP